MRHRAGDAGKESLGSKRNILTFNFSEANNNKRASPGLCGIYSDQSYPDRVPTPHRVGMLVISDQERMLPFTNTKTKVLERWLNSQRTPCIRMRACVPVAAPTERLSIKTQVDNASTKQVRDRRMPELTSKIHKPWVQREILSQKIESYERAGH